jgi:hypothetical protein
MNLIEKLYEVDWWVVDELSHIPTGAKGSSQEALRDDYAAYRKIHRKLSADLPARAALVQAVYNLRRLDRNFDPAYDAAFFFGGSTISRTLSADPLAAEIEAMAAQGGGGRKPVGHRVDKHQVRHADVTARTEARV